MVEIDALEPLKSGGSYLWPAGVFWQAFVYENIPTYCYNCDILGHILEECETSREEGSCPLQPTNFYEDSMTVEGGR